MPPWILGVSTFYKVDTSIMCIVHETTVSTLKIKIYFTFDKKHHSFLLQVLIENESSPDLSEQNVQDFLRLTVHGSLGPVRQGNFD